MAKYKIFKNSRFLGVLANYGQEAEGWASNNRGGFCRGPKGLPI